jgi:hypothetical protein
MIKRFENSSEPMATDGRDLDSQVAALIGEGAQQRSEGSPEVDTEQSGRVWKSLPEAKADDPTYFEQPLLQEPVWEWAIPLYYYIGGLSGASLALGAALQIRRDRDLDELVQQCHWIGFIGSSISGVLLVYDLGRPARFLNMLRVFRPTSPMNVGAWILSATGGAASAAVILRKQTGILRIAGQIAGVFSGIFGLGLATYTGVLVGNSAIPVWQASRKALPALFGSSAMTSVGSAFDLIGGNERKRTVTRAFGNCGKLLELMAAHVMDREASTVPRVGKPLREGASGLLWRGAAGLTAGSLVLSLLPRQNRGTRIAAGMLGTLGSLVMRFTVQHAGVLSARDARASFRQQRAGFGAAEVTGVMPDVP